MTAGLAPRLSALADALLRDGRRRWRVEAVRALWRRHEPIAAAAEDAPARFRADLAALEAAGVLALPTSPSAWDLGVVPPLPVTVTVTAAGPAVPAVRGPAVAWVPELAAFAAAERHPATLAALRAVNDWLKRQRGRAVPEVPVTERSLEIFGDEKRLDSFRNGDALFGGRLPLATLACRRLPPLLVWHPGPARAEARILVVENAAAFDSFRRFNEQAGLWRAVVWGAGNAFRRTHVGLDALFAATGTKHAVYFGDLDPKGVEILAAVARERLGDLTPHRGLYTALVAARRTRREEAAASATGTRAADLSAFLPELADTVLDLWAQGFVLPQEGFGTCALTENPDPAFHP
ncbi:Wadjet anti-phage system protein JetD domain-containing protein [Azospirillum canadense]|uniref:Wadjet anti-phage system protein JetD domain-containing protein n=1 Tax=Azospirillum canadense TaxID=403962 RepID=UPI00222604DD|nr:Wadjet anti-phage system protein JetD domain-containing protein [Azospirillum canadense]MCW2241762.1 hypothetical protein [Azospirillum canadense]